MADATLILAGGSGTRLWPASTDDSPKQLMRIGDGGSLVQRAVRLAMAATETGPIVIVTNKAHVAGIARHIAELESAIGGVSGRIVYLPEPVARNTAPAVTLGVAYLGSVLPPHATTLVLTADHVIGPRERFASDAAAACSIAVDGSLVCFGIVPDRPETGYGYVRTGPALGGGFRVEAFTEKPDRPTAARYLEEGGYFWNAGMFCFTIGRYMDELREHAPDIAAAFDAAPDAIQVSPRGDGSRSADPERLLAIYGDLPRISIDYAVMEKSRDAAVVPASFSWSDVGSWDEVARAAEADGGEAAADGSGRNDVIAVEAENIFVASDLPVAICGVSDIHVVVRNGKVLVCRRGSGQLVRDVVDRAQADGMDAFLKGPQ